MSENTTTVDLLNGLSEIAEYMQDDELMHALVTISKLVLRPDVPLNAATVEIVRLQAIAAKMAFRATWMANVDKADRSKKNIYYTASAEIDKLVNSLKFLIR
jgi:predicted S18 family serine protease